MSIGIFQTTVINSYDESVVFARRFVHGICAEIFLVTLEPAYIYPSPPQAKKSLGVEGAVLSMRYSKNVQI